MENFSQPSALARFSALLVFSSLTLAAFAWFGWSAFRFCTQIVENASAIFFDKGALYMFGAGSGLAVLTFGGLYEGILRLPLTEKVAKRITNALIGSIIVMFVLPQIVHYPVERFLEGRGYKICDQASYQWFLYRRIVYVSTSEVCADIIKNKK